MDCNNMHGMNGINCIYSYKFIMTHIIFKMLNYE